MDGGKLIASGSDSCVFIPNLPCRSNSIINKRKISKIMYNPMAKLDSQHEKKMNEEIKKINGYQKWAIIFDKYCKPPSLDKLLEYDKKGIQDCIFKEAGFEKKQIKEAIQYFDKNSYMMNGIYGGSTLFDIFKKSFREGLNAKQKDRIFLNLMGMMEPLFLGLKVMDENNFIHNDIKSNNIVVHDGVFKYIDFGLSNKLSNKKFFKERSLNEYNTGRIYQHYPLDYIFYYAPKKGLDKELEYNETGQVRANFNYLEAVKKSFGEDLYDSYYSIFNALKNKKISQDIMIKSIDTYSLGIQIPLLMVFYNNYGLLENPTQLILDFYSLFGLMTKSLSNERISPSNAYDYFIDLLNKYSISNVPRKKVVSRKKVSRKKSRNKVSRKKSRKKVSRKKV